MQEKVKNDSSEPPFYSKLSESDKFRYQELRRRLSSSENRYNRNKRLETFHEIIKQIEVFCIRNDEDDQIRCLVCGICWIKDGICVNTRQLRMLLNKSKSTINGSLQKIGYETVPAKGNDILQLIEAMPCLKTNFTEQRQWSIRKAKFQTDYDNSHEKESQEANCNNHHHDNDVEVTKCAFGCTCGCNCKINGEATIPCRCIYPDSTFEYGTGVCACEKIAVDILQQMS